jgi:hypothetical protein
MLGLSTCKPLGGGGDAITPTVKETSAAPTFSLTPGTYRTAQTVSLSTTTTGGTIYFTTNGTAPSASSSAYSSPLTVDATETIKAFTKKTDMNDSIVSSAA